MAVRNIYISGPDGVGKSTFAEMFSNHLLRRGRESKVIGFPARRTASYGLIRLHLDGRIECGGNAFDVLCVANRLEMIPYLKKLRTENPNLTFIFDRGPFDGGAYAEAIDSLRESPVGIKFDEILEMDQHFLKEFPVDLGILFAPKEDTVKEANIYEIREGKNETDVYDRNARLQEIVTEVFRRHLKGRENWIILEVFRPLSGETLEQSIGKQNILVVKIFNEFKKREGINSKERE